MLTELLQAAAILRLRLAVAKHTRITAMLQVKGMTMRLPSRVDGEQMLSITTKELFVNSSQIIQML